MSAVAIPCLICGTELEFSPGSRSAMCSICEEPRPLPMRFPDEIPSLEVGEGGAANVERLEGRVAASCGSCKSLLSVSADPGVCPYCEVGLEVQASVDPVTTVHGVLPFLLDRDAAVAAARAELGRLSLSAGAGPLRRLYLPWRLVSAEVQAAYEGRVGYPIDVYDPRTQQTVTKIEWNRAAGVVECSWDNQGGCASQVMGLDLGGRLEPWDFPFTEPVDLASLGEVPVEHLRIDTGTVLESAMPDLRQRLGRAALDEMESERKELGMVDLAEARVRVRLVLVPVYVGRTSMGQRYVVNARTGEVVVAGHARQQVTVDDIEPEADGGRSMRLVLAVLGIVAAIGLLAWAMMPS